MAQRAWLERGEELLRVQLEEIAELEKENEAFKRILAVAEAHIKLREQLGRAGRNRYKVQWAVIEYLMDTGGPGPSGKRRARGRRRAAGSRRWSLAYCAATVTSFKERGMRVGDGLRVASRASGFEERELRSFRDNVHRGKASQAAIDAYNWFVVNFRAISDEEFTAEAGRKMMGGLRENFPERGA